MEQGETPVDVELQGKVLDAMFSFKDIGDGVIKATIPDGLFDGSATVNVAGKDYAIYEIPGLDGRNGSPKIIERAIEKFVTGHGAPSWSQVVTAEIVDGTYNQVVEQPKTVYLKK